MVFFYEQVVRIEGRDGEDAHTGLRERRCHGGEHADLRELEGAFQLQNPPATLAPHLPGNGTFRAHHGELVGGAGDGEKTARRSPIRYRSLRFQTANGHSSGEQEEAEFQACGVHGGASRVSPSAGISTLPSSPLSPSSAASSDLVSRQWFMASMWTAITRAPGAELQTRATSSAVMVMGSPSRKRAAPALTRTTPGRWVRSASSTSSHQIVSPAT